MFRADGFHGQVRYPLYKFLLAPVQFRYLHIHIREQDIVRPRQAVHQLFNLSVNMGKFHLQGGDFRIGLCRFLSARQRLVAFQLPHHLLIDYCFQFGGIYLAAPDTAFVIQPLCAAEILLAGRVEDTHKRIPAVPALDFPRQPCVGGFSGGLDFHVVHQLLAAGQPCFRRDNSLMGRKHQHLVFQVVFLAGLYITALIQIAPVHACEVGGVIDKHRPLAFEKFVHIKVCLHIDGVA